MSWNEELGEWQLKCIAYTGNNMKKESIVNLEDSEVDQVSAVTFSLILDSTIPHNIASFGSINI